MIKAAMFDTKQYDRETFEKDKTDNIQITYYDTKLDLSTVSLANGFDCVIVFVNDNIDDKVIDALYSYGVKLIALRCAGFNNVDLKAAEGKICVCRVPAYSPNAVAEHAAALLLTSVRRIHKAYNRTREYNFSLSGFTGMTLCGKTVGVIGAGKIGRAFIDICKGFHMNVLVYDKFPDKDLDVNFVSLDELFEKSDIISLHCPLTEENYHMISEENIKK